MTPEQLAELMKTVTELRAKLEGQNQDFITKDMIDRMINDAVDKLHPKTKKFEFETKEQILEAAEDFKRSNIQFPEPKWESDYGKKFGDIRGFLKALKGGNSFTPHLKATMVEGTESLGGFVVPTEFMAEIILLMTNESIARRICRIIPMSTWKRTIPRQLTNVNVYWPAELGAKGTTNITGEQITQQAKVCAAVVKSSDELLRDSAINLQSFLAGLVAEAMALEEDRIVFAGNTGAADPFMGVLYETGVVNQTMAGASLDFDDIINLIFALPAKYRGKAKFVMHDNALKLIMKLKSVTGGQYLWSPPTGNLPANIWNIKYEVTDQIPTNLGAGTETAIEFGDWAKYLYISPRSEMTLKLSTDASDWVSSALDSAFMTDQTWLRFTSAKSINVALPAAFAKMLVK